MGSEGREEILIKMEGRGERSGRQKTAFLSHLRRQRDKAEVTSTSLSASLQLSL